MEREKHSIGKGQQSWEDISGAQFVPRDWSKFMASQESKQELPKFLLREWSGENSNKYAEILKDSTLFLCHETECDRLRKDRDQSPVSDEVVALRCNAEEADT